MMADEVLSADLRKCLRIVATTDSRRTFRVATRLRVSTSLALRLLKKLEARGLVERKAQYSAINDIYWDATAAGHRVLGDPGTEI